MYGLYRKTEKDGRFRYRRVEQISLFGCNEGYIPWLIAIPAGQGEPFKWHIDVATALSAKGMADQALGIDLKPNNIVPDLSLYELLDVWGNSDYGWTPIMMRLMRLFGQSGASAVDKADFQVEVDDMDEPIFSMTYLNGTVKDGALKGRWTPPRPGATNSVLLWPETFEYFVAEARKFM